MVYLQISKVIEITVHDRQPHWIRKINDYTTVPNTGFFGRFSPPKTLPPGWGEFGRILSEEDFLSYTKDLLVDHKEGRVFHKPYVYIKLENGFSYTKRFDSYKDALDLAELLNSQIPTPLYPLK